MAEESNQVRIVGTEPALQKVLEEDEYLDRMAKIIRRDFFSNLEHPSDATDNSIPGYCMSERSSQETMPGTERSGSTIRSYVRDRQKACTMGLNEYLEKYTSEDNAYFEKLQKKDFRRYRAKYPWLYNNKTNHNREVRDQLKLPSAQEQASISNGHCSNKMIDWPYKSNNSLFYAPNNAGPSSRKYQTIINYNSTKYMNELAFKAPLPPRDPIRATSLNKFCDKIGIDGKLINGSEAPTINGYSFVPQPETPQLEEPKIRALSNRFYIPNESPRDELAHRVYQEKVAKVIRTPKTSESTPSLKTPLSFGKGYVDFSFSPERVKSTTPRLRRNK